MSIRHVFCCQDQHILLVVNLVDASVELQNMHVGIIVDVVVRGKLIHGTRLLAPGAQFLMVGLLHKGVVIGRVNRSPGYISD